MGTFKSFKGENLKRWIVSEPAEVAKKRSNNAYEADILFTHRFLIDKVDSIEKCPIKTAFIDVEIQAPELPNVAEAKYPISCISVYNSLSKSIQTFFLPDYPSEFEMLEAFIAYLKKERFDIMAGWNFTKFDFPYLCNRYPDFSEKISPISKVRYGDGNVFYPAGVSIIDYLMWFKKITLNREKVYTLDAISQKYLHEAPKAKINFMDLSFDLKQRNINDVKCLAKLEDLKKLIPYFDTIRRMTKIEWEDFEWNSRMIDMLLLEEAKKKHVVLPMKPSEKMGTLTEEIEFEGAYREVYAQGRFENVGKYDLSSAYPYAIIDFCLDPANIKEEFITKHTQIVINNTRFEQNPNALLPTVAKKLITLKNMIKDELSKTPVDSPNYKDLKLKYDAIKTIVNSAYGVMGNRYFRLYDNRVASATTFIVRSLLHYVKDKIEEKGYKVLYVDTDSVFIQSKDNLTEILNNIVQEWGKTFGKEKINVEFDYEGYFESIIILTKCRYHAWLRKKNGELEEETKGIEAKRKDSTEYMKNFQKAFLEKIHQKEAKEKIFEWIKTEINNFKAQKLQDIAFPCKIAKAPEEYKNIPIFVRAIKNTPNLSFNPKVGDNFYYVYMEGKDEDKKDMVMAFDEENFSHVLREEIDWQRMLERNIIMKLDVIFEAMGWLITDVYTAPPTSKLCSECAKEKSLSRFPDTGTICNVCIKKIEKKKEKEATKQNKKSKEKKNG
jgi:DNA polymerase I